MKRLLIYSLFIFFILTNCQNETTEFMEFSEETMPVDELTGVQRDIVINILSSHFNGYKKSQKPTRSSNDFSLTPYIEERDTLLYVAQYSNGWEIYSSIQSTPMLLFSSPSGVFSMDDPNMPSQLKFLIKSHASAIKKIATKKEISSDSSWGHVALGEQQLSKGNITMLINNSRVQAQAEDLPPGHWVLIETERVLSESNTSPKLVQTKWGQSEPWNRYAKWAIDPSDNTLKQCVAGCVPVAVSQYMYFTHYKDGIPLSSVTNASVISNGTDYQFYGSSSSIWDNMAKYWFQNGTEKSALLIGDTGRKLDSTYGVGGTWTNVNTCVSFLTNTYNTVFQLENFDFDKVKISIDNGYPLLARARDTDDGGHTFIIDQYQIETRTQRYLYGLVRDPLPPGVKDKWMADKIDENGNIIEYAYTNEVFQDFHSNNVSMNWGYSGSYDDTFYYYNGNWEVGEYNFSIEHQLYSRFD